MNSTECKLERNLINYNIEKSWNIKVHVKWMSDIQYSMTVLAI
jgi:hypothetical protein